MGIRSFLVHVHPGDRDVVAAALAAEPGCDVLPATNRDLVVVVSEHDGRDAEEAFDRRVATLPGVTAVAMVAGFASQPPLPAGGSGETG